MKIAVSACLLGVECRFDGKSKPDLRLAEALRGHELVAVCPEVAGGLPIPHPPCEIVAFAPSLQVVDSLGHDVTSHFLKGAAITVESVLRNGCEICVMKSKSPSCGCSQVYDGTFSGALVDGEGVAVRALRDAGLVCVDEVEACSLVSPMPQA